MQLNGVHFLSFEEAEAENNILIWCQCLGMLLKRINPTPQLLESFKEGDIDEIISITKKLCKDMTLLLKYSDVPKYFEVSDELRIESALRCLIMNGKLNVIYKHQFEPIQCEADFRLLDESIDCSEMEFIYELKKDNYELLAKIDRILEYHNILQNIKAFENQLFFLQKEWDQAKVFKTAEKYVFGSLFLNIEFYKIFLKSVCAYDNNYEVFDNRYEEFALFLIQKQQIEYNQDYFSKCYQVYQKIVQNASNADKLFYLKKINTGEAEIMKVGIDIFIESNSENEKYTEEFEQLIRKFADIECKIDNCYLLNSILKIGSYFGVHEVVNESNFEYTQVEKIVIDDSIELFKQESEEKQELILNFFRMTPNEDLLRALEQDDAPLAMRLVKQEVSSEQYNTNHLLKLVYVPKFLSVDTDLLLESAIYEAINLGKLNVLYNEELKSVPCDSDFRTIEKVDTQCMDFYFKECGTLKELQDKLEFLIQFHNLSNLQLKFVGTLETFDSVVENSRQMSLKYYTIASLMLNFEEYKLFLASICGYNLDFEYNDERYEIFAEFLKENEGKQYNEDYFSRCGYYYEEIQYYIQKNNAMDYLNLLNCEQQEILSFGISVFQELNPDEQYSAPFMQNLDKFLIARENCDTSNTIMELICTVKLYSILYGEKLPLPQFEFEEIEQLNLVECSPFEDIIISELRLSNTPEKIEELLLQIWNELLINIDEALKLLLQSTNAELLKYGVEFYAYRKVKNAILLLMHKLIKDGHFYELIDLLNKESRNTLFNDHIQLLSFMEIYRVKEEEIVMIMRPLEEIVEYIPTEIPQFESKQEYENYVDKIFGQLEPEELLVILIIAAQNMQFMKKEWVSELYGFDFIFDHIDQMRDKLQHFIETFRQCGCENSLETVFIGKSLIRTIFVKILCEYKEIFQYVLLNLAGYYTNNISLIELFEENGIYDSERYLTTIIVIESSEYEFNDLQQYETKLQGIEELKEFIFKLQISNDSLFRFELFHIIQFWKSDIETEDKQLSQVLFILFVLQYIKTFNTGMESIVQQGKQYGFDDDCNNADNYCILLLDYLITNKRLDEFIQTFESKNENYSLEQMGLLKVSLQNCCKIIEQDSYIVNIVQHRYELSGELYAIQYEAFELSLQNVESSQQFEYLFEQEPNCEVSNKLICQLQYVYELRNGIYSELFNTFKNNLLLKQFDKLKSEEFCSEFYEIFEISEQSFQVILDNINAFVLKQYSLVFTNLQSYFDNHAIIFLLECIIEQPEYKLIFPISSIIFSDLWEQIEVFVNNCPEKISNWYLEYLDKLNIECASDFVSKSALYLHEITDISELKVTFNESLSNILKLYLTLGFSKVKIAEFIIQYCLNKKILSLLFESIFENSNREFAYMEEIIEETQQLQELLTYQMPNDLRKESANISIELPESVVLEINYSNNDSEFEKVINMFSNSVQVFNDILSCLTKNSIEFREEMKTINETLIKFNNEFFSISEELYKVLIISYLLELKDILLYIIDVYLCFETNIELYNICKNELFQTEIYEIIALKEYLESHKISFNRGELFQCLYAYKSVFQLYKKITQNFMLFNRKLQILTIEINDYSIQAGIEYLLIELSIADLIKHKQLYPLIDNTNAVKENQELGFTQLFCLFVNCLTNSDLQTKLLNQLISDEYMNMKEEFIGQSEIFISKLLKLNLENEEKTPNFWLNTLCQNISNIANQEFTSVLASCFESYSSCLDPEFALKNADNLLDCFKQQKCNNPAYYSLLQCTYYDFDEQIEKFTQLLTVNDMAFMLIHGIIKAQPIQKYLQYEEQEFLRLIIENGYMVDYLEEILERTDLLQQALDVGHLFCSRDQVEEFIASKLCQDYLNESLQSSIPTSQQQSSECLVLEEKNNNLPNITENEALLLSDIVIPPEEQPEEPKGAEAKSEVSTNLTFTTSVEIAKAEINENQLSETSESDNNAELLLASEYIRPALNIVSDEAKQSAAMSAPQICYCELYNPLLFNTPIIADKNTFARISACDTYKVRYESNYFLSDSKEDDGIELLEAKRESSYSEAGAQSEAPGQNGELVAPPALFCQAQQLSINISELCKHDYTVQLAEVTPLLFDSQLENDDFFEYSESDLFEAAPQYIEQPFSNVKLSTTDTDLLVYEQSYYVNNINSLEFEKQCKASANKKHLEEIELLKRFLLSYEDCICNCPKLQLELEQIADFTDFINPLWSIFELSEMENQIEAHNTIAGKFEKYLSAYKAQTLKKLQRSQIFKIVIEEQFAEKSTSLRFINAIKIIFTHFDTCGICENILTKCTSCNKVVIDKFKITCCVENPDITCQKCARLCCKKCNCGHCE